MPVVFGVDVGSPEEVDLDWDIELMDTNTGRKVYDLSHQYVPPDQLFASSKDGPCLRNCHSCATVMQIEELIQVKRELPSEVDVFGYMENQYPSDLVLICYVCVQTLTGTPDTSCPSVFSEVAEAFDQRNYCMPQESMQQESMPQESMQQESMQQESMPQDGMQQEGDWTTATVKMEVNDGSFSNAETTVNIKQENATDDFIEKDDSGEKEMENSETSDESVEKQEMKEDDDSGVDFSVEDPAIYTCKICDSEFKTMDEFGKHTRTHDRIKASLTCDVNLPDNKFYDDLKKHGGKILQSIKEQKISRKEKIKKLKLRKCSVCSWAFHRRSELKKHRRKVHAKCIFCNDYFMDEKHCKKHIVEENCNVYKKSKEKETSPREIFPCTTCEKVLFSQDDLTRHLKMHITYKKCKICGSKIRSGDIFTSHISQHKIDQTGYSMDSFPQTPENLCIEQENEKRGSFTSITPDHSLQEVDLGTSTMLTTWRQLSLQLKNKTSSDQDTNETDIRRSSISISNAIVNEDTTSIASNSPTRSNHQAGSNTFISDPTNTRQTCSTIALSDDMHHPIEKVCHKRKRTSSEKENISRLPESSEEIILTKKLSMKSNTKKIYFKKSPDISTNKQHLRPTFINAQESVRSCNP